MSKKSRMIEREIKDGAFTTPSGDPIVEIRECIDGWCVYCGEAIPTKVAVTKAGMTIAAPGHCTMRRWFNNRLEPWHIECFERWVFHWSMRANKTVHLVECRFADPDAPTFQGTRGEARHVLNDRFCRHCAPIENWIEVAA